MDTRAKLNNKKQLSFHIFGIIIILFNIALIAKICQLVITGNDKAILFFIFYYPILIIINLILGFALNRWIPQVSKYFIYSVGGILILALPLMIWTSSFE